MDIKNYAKTFEKLSKLSKKMKHHQTLEKSPKQQRSTIRNAYSQQKCGKTGDLESSCRSLGKNRGKKSCKLPWKSTA